MKYTKHTFPRTHKLKKWYPSLDLRFKGSSEVFYSAHANLFFFHGEVISINGIIQPIELADNEYWERCDDSEHRLENLNATVYSSTTNRLLGEYVTFDDGRIIKIKSRIRKSDNEIVIVTSIINKNTEGGEDWHILVKKEDSDEPEHTLTDPNFQIVNIIAKLENGTIIDTTFDDKEYYVVDKRKDRLKVEGPFHMFGFASTTNFAKFKTREEAKTYVLFNDKRFSPKEIIGVLKERVTDKHLLGELVHLIISLSASFD